jgi:hypothetical protein
MKDRYTNLTKQYRGMTSHEARIKAIAEASDNGRCWWIKDFLVKNPNKHRRNR